MLERTVALNSLSPDALDLQSMLVMRALGRASSYIIRWATSAQGTGLPAVTQTYATVIIGSTTHCVHTSRHICWTPLPALQPAYAQHGRHAMSQSRPSPASAKRAWTETILLTCQSQGLGLCTDTYEQARC